MSARALWLPDVLRGAGLPVALDPGWEGRGQPFTQPIGAVVCHHTAGPEGCNACSLRTVREGRPGLRNLLSQLLLAQDGTFIVVGSGSAWHAGKSRLRGKENLNDWTIGIEAENSGKPSDPIVGVQYDNYVRGVAAILKYLQRGPEWAAAHKEVAIPLGRKPDPTFNMDEFRANVGRVIGGTQPPQPPRPPEPPHGGPNLKVDGNFGPATIRALQARLAASGAKVAVDGAFGPQSIRGLQGYLNHLNGPVAIDGKLGPQTIRAMQNRIGAHADGSWGAGTTRALQKALNEGRF